MVCRLGLATRSNTHLTKDDVLFALEQGLNYWNWCGYEDGMAQAIRELGPKRKQVVISAQLSARDSQGLHQELEQTLDQILTDYLDVATLYSVEQATEWEKITSPTGALKGLRLAQKQGLVRMIGLTTHQRHLALRVLNEDLLDLLMIRYNAAHRGAEDKILPTAQTSKKPIVAFTALRWSDLLKSTPEDPPNFVPPSAHDWYRFMLAHPAVSVVLAAPTNRLELSHNLRLLADWKALTSKELQTMRDHGDRVHRHARKFI